MLLHKWGSNKKAQAHSLALWYHMKYPFALMGHKDKACLHPVSMSQVLTFNHNLQTSQYLLYFIISAVSMVVDM